jgi:hypothetical protein
MDKYLIHHVFYFLSGAGRLPAGILGEDENGYESGLQERFV